MPILNVTLSSKPDMEQSSIIAVTLSHLTATILHKDPALTAVVITHIASAHWFVGGVSLDAQDKSSFFLDIRVTDETNTAKEKANYIAAVFKAMSELLGDLHDTSYIHIHDARATAWGYAGLTQQYRAVQNSA